jgi:OmcA/MtrC family decaheme c-type cytochrome
MGIPPLLLHRTSRGLSLVVIALTTLLTAGSIQSPYSPADKAYYADANLINFVRPGLSIKIVSAEIATDGTIKTRVQIADPKGVPLDREGIVTPGAVSLSFVAAYIPKGQAQYTAYTTRVQTSPITKVSATQAGADSGGVYTKNADGDYTYTFGTKAPSGYDRTATHTIGVYGSRNLTEFDLGTDYASAASNFVPDGSKVATVRDVIKTASCNKCHDELAFHGGSRRGIELCVLCHTPQTTDPDTGNTVDLPVMVHKIHMGEELPSVQAGKPYQIIGFNQSVSDWSSVAFPSDPRRCEACHEQNTGATQAANYLMKPARAACGACHDNVNFATGENHANLPQVSDNQCSTCHIPQGELDFDVSIKGAHVIPERAPSHPGIVVDILRVADGTAGKKPVITWTLKDLAGKPIPLADMKTLRNRVGLVLAGPAPDYGYTNFGADVTTGGYVAEDATNGTCDSTGTCTYTFTHAVPADAKGTYSIGIEARRDVFLLPGTTKQVQAEYGAQNKVVYFSVDGSTMAPRRKVVDTAKCNQCHTFLSLHGENRNQVEHCVTCHNASETDQARRPMATVPEDKNTPPQAVSFAYMIHRIHTGENLKEQGAGYIVVGFGGSHNDFSEVRFPAFSKAAAVGATNNCSLCHVDGSEQNLPLGLKSMKNPQGPLNPVGTITAACTGCHASIDVWSHALANTTTLGESCTTCHSAAADFSVARVHAQ